MPAAPSKTKVAALKTFWRNAGYRRKPSAERTDEGHTTYKKGWEMRFVAEDEATAQRIVDLLLAVGVTPGRPFDKHSRVVVPVYGKVATRYLRKLLT